MKQTTLPRIPGHDFAGAVEAGLTKWIGAEVWGTGGNTGFTRDGTHAELIAVPVASLRRKPTDLSFDQAAAVGVNYMVAWCGIEAADLKAGETVLLIVAGGGVGGATAQIGVVRLASPADRGSLLGMTMSQNPYRSFRFPPEVIQLPYGFITASCVDGPRPARIFGA